MADLKSKEMVVNLLYVIAVILLATNIYLDYIDKEIRFVEIGAWGTFLIASIFAIYVRKEKKEQD